MAKSYLTALAEHDWKAVCETRAPTEREEFAQTGGSRERVLKILIKARPGADQVFAEAEIGDVRVTGDVAGADVVQPGQQQPATTLAAVRENSQWFLKDLPDGQIP